MAREDSGATCTVTQDQRLVIKLSHLNLSTVVKIVARTSFIELAIWDLCVHFVYFIADQPLKIYLDKSLLSRAQQIGHESIIACLLEIALVYKSNLYYEAQLCQRQDNLLADHS